MAAKFTDPAHIVLTTDYSTAEVPEGAYRRLPQPDLFAGGGGAMWMLLVTVLDQVHAVLQDAILLLQPTSPFRREATGRLVVESLLCSTREKRWGSVCSAERYPDHWHPNYQIVPDQEFPARRQDLPPAYRPDGGFYGSTLLQLIGGSWGSFAIVPSTPGESSSIDTEDDWTEAERLVRDEDQ